MVGKGCSVTGRLVEMSAVRDGDPHVPLSLSVGVAFCVPSGRRGHVVAMDTISEW